MQPLLRVEHVGEAEQVVLVGAAAVVQDEQAGGVAGRRALAEREVAHGTHSASWGAAPMVRPRRLGHHDRVSLFWRVVAINGLGGVTP